MKLSVQKIELLEMQVEAALVQRRTLASDDGGKYSRYPAAIRPWAQLFEHRYRDRTMIGILMMCFQRAYKSSID